MIFVFLAGALGFLVFDAYRIRTTYEKHGILAVTLATPLGIAVHVFVYVAAGILAIVISFDAISRCCSFLGGVPTDSNFVGSLLRGFALGLAGPAGLAKGKAEVSAAGTIRTDLGDLAGEQSAWRRISASLNILLMR